MIVKWILQCRVIVYGPASHASPASGGPKKWRILNYSDQSMVITPVPSEAKVSNKAGDMSAQKGPSVQYDQSIDHIILTEVIRATARAGINDLCVRRLAIARYLNCLQK
jgi:hypothetical protein